MTKEFIIRNAVSSDLEAIKSLYKKAATIKDGIARTPEEITHEYIKNNLEKSLNGGICLVIENPQNPQELIAELHAYKHEAKSFQHTLGNMTMAVDPDFLGNQLGKKLFVALTETIKNSRPDIIRVELDVRKNNERAMKIYQSVGFEIECEQKFRILDSKGNLTSDVQMVWFNPNFKKQIQT